MIFRVHTIVLVAILMLATALRVYQLGSLPDGLFCDEAALGYNAYSLWETGKDELGNPFPLYFWSFSVSYKNPIYIYSAIAPIALLGLSEFSLRLTSAAFGVGTVIAVFYLGRALFSTGVGLLAALALAICPWHLHFSRIAFELISFPFLFTVGLVLLVRFTQGRRTLPAAFFFLGFSLYSYAVAKLFVPLFLVGFGLLYVDKLWRHWRQTLLAVAVIVATVGPVVHFDLNHQQHAQLYFRNTTMLRPEAPLREQAERFGRNYLEFFSRQFLFQEGDRIVRHAVRGHGELYPAFLPMLLVGAAAALIRRERASKLVLLWLALYPAAASLMTEIPSASRGFIGVVPFCLLVALGAGSVLWTIAWVVRWRPAVIVLQGAALAAGATILAPEVRHYLELYWRDYRVYSAPGYGGFQYGYRDMIHYMESERANYKRIMMTAREVNQPYIFPLFYRPVDPAEYHRTRQTGYEVLDSAEFSRYSTHQPILYALRESELRHFSDYTVKKLINAPSGNVEFVIAEVRGRKTYLENWLSLGLFDNAGLRGMTVDYIQPDQVNRGSFAGKFGEIQWRPVQQNYLQVDLNRFYARSDHEHPGNPEYVCAYSYTTVRAPVAQSAFLELAGSDDEARVWLNGRSLTREPLRLSERPKQRPIELRAGDNGLMVKSCENIGGWYFAARVTDEAGRDLPGLTTSDEFPVGGPPTVQAAETAPDIQLVEGFDAIVSYRQTQERYPDYRGGTESWWEHLHHQDPEVVWRSAICPEKKTTVLVFTATLGMEPGVADLYLNGKHALSFPTNGEGGTKIVERGGYRWVFVSKQVGNGNSGVVYLTVPAEDVSPGQPLELRVRHSSGDRNAWFMVKGYRDTIAFEHVTPAVTVAVASEGWKEVTE